MIEYYTTDFLYFYKTKKSCMEIKIIRKSGCAIICSLCFIALCMPFIDIHNDMESTMYSDVKEAKEYEIDYECMKYLDKHPNEEHSQEVSDILLSKMKKDGDVVRTYKLGRRYTSLKVGTELKELAYKIAETKNDYYSWSQYIEVCDSIDIKDARERLNAFIH